MKKKRYSALKPKPYTLTMQWGKVPHDEPGICTTWGEGCAKGDSNLLFYYFGSKRPPTVFDKGVWQPSLLDELDRRGYDMTTLKFTIQKKQVKSDE